MDPRRSVVVKAVRHEEEPGRARGASGWLAVAVLAFDTWRLAWREVMTRVELLMLLILAAVSGVAAIGSPDAANGTVQVLAVCLDVVPFALVLVAGQIWRRSDDEAALFARPLTAVAYVAGRGAGLFAVGAAQLVAVNVVAGAVLVAVAHLGLGSFVWDAWWSLLVVTPSLVLMCGVLLLAVTVSGGGSRYYTPAILGALLVAFGEYKLSALAAATSPHLALWSPFPALLTLGLAMPPAMETPTAAWLVGNRLFYAALGIGLALGAVWVRGRGTRTPGPRPEVLKIALAIVALGVLAGGIGVEVAAAALSPALLPPAVVREAAGATAALAPGRLSIHLTARPEQGTVLGIATWTGAVDKPSAVVYVWLNAGLTITQAVDGQAPLDVVRVDGQAVEPGTAASLWLLAGRLASGQPLRITYSGRLLPAATLLPTPPFQPGVAYEGGYLAPGQLLLDGNGSWYPRILAPGAGGAPLASARQLVLAVGAGAGARAFTTLTRGSAPGTYLSPAAGPWPRVLWLSGPYHLVDWPHAQLAAGPGPAAVAAVGLAPYVSSWGTLWPWLPGAGPTLEAVVSPVATHPLLSGSLLALPGNQPYCTPPDPVTAACGGIVAAPLAARLFLSQLAWANALGLSGGNLPRLAAETPTNDARAALVPVLAVVSSWRGLTGPAATEVAAAWTHGQALPAVGTLSAAQRQEAAQLAASAAYASPSAFRAFAARLATVPPATGLTWTMVEALEKS